MIRSYISALAVESVAAQGGPFRERQTDSSFKPYPLFIDDDNQAAYLRLGAGEALATSAVYTALHQICLRRKIQLGLAESCTGGLVAATITDQPGSSKYLYGAWVVYSNHAKYQFLQVSPHDLEEHGAVSSIVVADLLRGIFANSPCTHGAAISGIAGPEGGSAAKPVGTVWIGVAQRGGSALVREFRLDGDRAAIRQSAVALVGLMLMELFWLLENNVDTLQKL